MPVLFQVDDDKVRLGAQHLSSWKERKLIQHLSSWKMLREEPILKF